MIVGNLLYNKSMKQIKLLVLLLLLLSSCKNFSNRIPELPSLCTRNVILIIADGMGPEQVKAAGYYGFGESGSLSFENFPSKSKMTTYSQNLFITDSAASATAMATGEKVFNGVLSMDIPGSRNNLKTVLEIAAENGMSTGLVSTAFMTHATPAAFAAHTESRSNYEEIGKQYLNLSRPNILFGGGHESLTKTAAQDAGYEIVSDARGLKSLVDPGPGYYMGAFGDGHMPYMYDGPGDLPELSDMALKALDILEENDKGFFLMIESGRIDHAGHANDLIRNIYEVLELSDTVEKILEWADNRRDTLIIVSADHETGALSVLKNNGTAVLPDVKWGSRGHSYRKVPVYLWGDRAEELAYKIKDNTDIFSELLRE